MTTKDRVIALLGITDQQYCDNVLEFGTDFAMYYTNYDSQAAQWLTYTAAYWEWFENQFEIVDNKFLATYKYEGDDSSVREALTGLWLENHGNKIQPFPDKEVIKQSYAVMMGKVFDETHKSKTTI